jgi:hypothetical protein
MAVGNNLTLTFSEAVVKGTGLIQLYNASNTLVESFDVASSALVTGWNGSTLTINPTNNLTASTGYYLKIASTAIKDTAGNAYAGINDTTTLNFTTAASDGSVFATPTYSVGTGSTLGLSVSSAGDVNGDGFDDLIVGARGANAAYVVYGNAAGLAVDLASGSIAADKGFQITGPSSLGQSVSSAGDMNGDGFADLIVGWQQCICGLWCRQPNDQRECVRVQLHIDRWLQNNRSGQRIFGAICFERGRRER